MLVFAGAFHKQIREFVQTHGFPVPCFMRVCRRNKAQAVADPPTQGPPTESTHLKATLGAPLDLAQQILPHSASQSPSQQGSTLSLSQSPTQPPPSLAQSQAHNVHRYIVPMSMGPSGTEGGMMVGVPLWLPKKLPRA
jgi:hypothetical protein